MVLKVLFHTFLVFITGGVWLIVLIIWALLGGLKKNG